MAASLRSVRSVAKAVLPEPRAAELIIGDHAHSTRMAQGFAFSFDQAVHLHSRGLNVASRKYSAQFVATQVTQQIGQRHP
jgi:hypothetical protein